MLLPLDTGKLEFENGITMLLPVDTVQLKFGNWNSVLHPLDTWQLKLWLVSYYQGIVEGTAVESTVTATERADEGAMATSTATPSRFKKAGEEAIAAGEKAGEGAATTATFAMSQLRDGDAIPLPVDSRQHRFRLLSYYQEIVVHFVYIFGVVADNSSSTTARREPSTYLHQGEDGSRLEVAKRWIWRWQRDGYGCSGSRGHSFMKFTFVSA